MVNTYIVYVQMLIVYYGSMSIVGVALKQNN